MSIEQRLRDGETPETDALTKRTMEETRRIPALAWEQHARRLERQRDVAVELLERMSWHIAIKADADEVHAALALIRGDEQDTPNDDARRDYNDANRGDK